MTWKTTKAISARCAHALAWCRAFVGQFDAKRLKRVEFVASRYRNVVGDGSTRSTYGVPHTITVQLNLECDGGDLMWEESPVYVSRQSLAVSRSAAEQAAREHLKPGQLLGEMRVVSKRVRFAVWSRYSAGNLGIALVWVFSHEAWHWLTGGGQIKAANTEQYARAAACRMTDMYVAGVDPEHAAAYLRSHAVDIVHYAHQKE
jgi:hypothetical protein